MALGILSDNDQQLSVLWDSTTGRAYGYVTTGEGHRELLQVFMDGLETHVAAFTDYELQQVWDSFTATVREGIAAGEQTDSGATEGTEATPPTDTGTGTGPASEPTDTTGQAGTDGAAGTGSQSVDPTQGSTESSQTSMTESGVSAEPTQMQCFNCNGTGTAPITGGKCAVCDGTGSIVVSPTEQATG